MVAQAFTVDLDKPLVFQVGYLEEQYQDWVHQPIVSKEGPRFFANDVLEFLTRTKWWAVPLIWLLVVCWCLNTSIQMGHTVPEVALMVVAGIFIWTLVEYVLHRYLFHIDTKSYWTNTAHYLPHGCHHKHPIDGLRFVFPPTAAAILCYPFWNFVKLFTTTTTTPGVFGGGLLGYVIYDCTHYLHHAHPSFDPAKYLKKYHLNHHFRIKNKGFGITSTRGVKAGALGRGRDRSSSTRNPGDPWRLSASHPGLPGFPRCWCWRRPSGAAERGSGGGAAGAHGRRRGGGRWAPPARPRRGRPGGGARKGKPSGGRGSGAPRGHGRRSERESKQGRRTKSRGGLWSLAYWDMVEAEERLVGSGMWIFVIVLGGWKAGDQPAAIHGRQRMLQSTCWPYSGVSWSRGFVLAPA